MRRKPEPDVTAQRPVATTKASGRGRVQTFRMARADIFSSGKMRKSSNEAPESVVRKIGMIVELLRHQRIAFSRYAAQYERDYRSFQRDLQQLRKIGVHAGFQISHIKDNEFVDLVALDKKTRNLHPVARNALSG